MKKLIKITSIIYVALFFISCDHTENEALPDFLDGTEYGILLHVNLNTATTINIADVNTANISFDIAYEGDGRTVESIIVNKIFSPNGGTNSAEIQHSAITSFPSTVTLSANDLVSNVPGVSLEDLAAGDKFQIRFTIKYQDGKTVSRFGTRLNPNFDITFE